MLKIFRVLITKLNYYDTICSPSRRTTSHKTDRRNDKQSLFGSLLKLPSYATKRNLIIATVSSFATTLFAFYRPWRQKTQLEDENKAESEVKSSLKRRDGDQQFDELESHLINRAPLYIEKPNLENLLSLARYQSVLISIRLYNKKPSWENRQRVIEELAKLSDCDETTATSAAVAGDQRLLNHQRQTIVVNYDGAAKRIEELIRIKLKKTKHAASRSNPFLNNGLANYISQCLSNEMMIELALKLPGVDTRFFRSEPPSTIYKLNRMFDQSPHGSLSSTEYTIHEDADYALLFEFSTTFVEKLLADRKAAQNKKSSTNKPTPYSNNKDLVELLERFRTELNSLIVSEYFLNQASINIWSPHTESDYLAEVSGSSAPLLNMRSESRDDDDDESEEEKEARKKVSSLKEKIKNDFIHRNEMLMLSIVDKMVRLDLHEFVRLGGLELLLLLYEKHKHDEYYLNIIGNCLCLISLEEKYKILFAQSGWLKRLSRMLVEKKHNELYNELIAHKILFNLNQQQHKNEKRSKLELLYSTMIYPLHPMYSSAISQANELSKPSSSKDNEATETNENNKNSSSHERDHVVDVVFIHGLRGSVFKTWRQDDSQTTTNTTTNSNRTNPPSVESSTSPPPQQPQSQETNFIDAFNNLIAKYFDIYSDCWPKDWLPLDLLGAIRLGDDEFELDSLVDIQDSMNQVQKYRLIGINYDTLYSLWGEELIDDKKLKLSIKQRAIDLLEQLKLARIGVDRPVVWVCHSMGGLIVKQMLVDSRELLNNTKALVFISTPHLGSNVAKTAAKFSFATKPSPEIIELSTNSKYLIELNEKFLREMHRSGSDMNIMSMLERQPLHIGFNIYTETVPEASGRLGLGDFYWVENRDHINICKPENRDSAVYTRIRDIVNRTIETESLTCARCKREYELDKSRRLGEIFYEFFKLNYFY